MTKCPFHGQMTSGEPQDCPLQRLANHTINVTKARSPRVAILMVLVDLDDPSHTACGSNLRPEFAAGLLERYARDIRAGAG